MTSILRHQPAQAPRRELENGHGGGGGYAAPRRADYDADAVQRPIAAQPELEGRYFYARAEPSYPRAVSIEGEGERYGGSAPCSTVRDLTRRGKEKERRASQAAVTPYSTPPTTPSRRVSSVSSSRKEKLDLESSEDEDVVADSQRNNETSRLRRHLS
ncbi:hypothetical protein CPC08DRAFT_716005 [Agrocybe pediades]|nr:hypothetical protein CPC08DRAFT_716005 [Agrocybe pediades]